MSTIVAVSMVPAMGRVRETEFHKADDFHFSKSGQTLRIIRNNVVVASYDRQAIRGVRRSNAKLRTSKVTFVRRFVAADYQ